MNERIRRLGETLATLNADAFLVTNEINVRYLTGFTGDSSALLVQSGDCLMISYRRRSGFQRRE